MAAMSAGGGGNTWWVLLFWWSSKPNYIDDIAMHEAYRKGAAAETKGKSKRPTDLKGRIVEEGEAMAGGARGDVVGVSMTGPENGCFETGDLTEGIGGLSGVRQKLTKGIRGLLGFVGSSPKVIGSLPRVHRELVEGDRELVENVPGVRQKMTNTCRKFAGGCREDRRDSTTDANGSAVRAPVLRKALNFGSNLKPIGIYKYPKFSCLEKQRW
ncbi:hypothetical protein BHM03_00028263 [Ensete ventricosum]|nr:hypothetical protein BHM03_00028263 [Ensete ventricosum]